MRFPAVCFSVLLMVLVVQGQGYYERDGYIAIEDITMEDVSTDNPAVQKKILDQINECRRTVEPPACNMLEVTWNDEAKETAKKWAKTCAFNHSLSAARQITEYGCGENLYMTSYLASWDEAILAFCNEKFDYIYGKGPRKIGDIIGHYTQLVWFSSSKVGCAYHYCPDGPKYQHFYVCHQCPPGNVKDVPYPYKAGYRCRDCPNDCRNKLCTNACDHDDLYGNCDVFRKFCDKREDMKKGCKATCRCKGKIY